MDLTIVIIFQNIFFYLTGALMRLFQGLEFSMDWRLFLVLYRVEVDSYLIYV
jgi:hypothetical protein